jgi:hypothetical protein
VTTRLLIIRGVRRLHPRRRVDGARSGPRSLLAAIIAIVAAVALAAPTLAADFGPIRVLRTAPSGTDLRVGDIASASNLAVVWEEGSKSYVRWVENGAESFEARRPLRGGAPASDPQVATCGRYIWAVSTWLAASGPPRIGIQLWNVPPAFPFEDGFFPVGVGRDPDVACAGQWYGIAWFDTSTRPAHVKLRLSLLSKHCEEPCVGSYVLDLGPGQLRRGLTIAMSSRPTSGGDPGTDVHVGWVQGNELRYKRITVHPTDATIRPTTTLASGPSVHLPFLSTDERRVVLAYLKAGGTHARISEDRGRTFGPRRGVWPAPCRDCEAGSFPTGVDAAAGRILVETFGGENTDFRSVAFLSSDGGATWSEISTHATGRKVGAVVDMGPVVGVAEAWDSSLRNPAPAQHRLRYHFGPD